MLKVENVSKIYGNKKILNNLSFHVPEGEIYTLVGSPNEGKTTLLHMIAGFERVDEGNIYVSGTDCQLSADKARKMYGYVPDIFPSYPTMTVKEYMRFFGRMMDFSDDEKIRHLTVNLLNFVGLKKVMDKRVCRLNRGQKQKLSIARALLHNPKLIILDEPFLGLDVETVHDIKEILDFLHQQGRTIFMTSDNLQLSASLSTSVGIIENGTMLYGDQTKEAYENMRNHSVQLQYTGYIDQEEISRRLHEESYMPDEEISRQLHEESYMPDEEISRQLHEESYMSDEEISRQLHEESYMSDEEISRQLHEESYMLDEEISRQLYNTAYMDQEEISRQLHNTAYVDHEDISRQLHEKKEEEDSFNDLSDLGLDIEDFTPNFKELEYTNSIYDNINNEVTRMPYDEVTAIESTKRSEDMSKRVYIETNTKKDRGIVEKRGVGGSRVVTDKNNYRKK